MYKEKIEIFLKENPDKEFPWFEFLHPGTAEVYRLKLLRKMKLDPETSPAKQEEHLYKSYTFLDGINADSNDFCFSEVFRRLNITPEQYVFIDWFRFSHIDKMEYTDLETYFDYIWYAGPDDINIFDNTFKWIVSVNHHGRIGWLKFDKK